MCQLTWGLYITFIIYLLSIVLGVGILAKEQVTPALWPALLSFSTLVSLPFILLNLIIQG